MDMENEPLRASTAPSLSPTDDLSRLSEAELTARIADLRAEIARTETALASKRGARTDAESVFKI